MITDEGLRLGRHWDRLGATVLDRYLIQDVEHPALNPQSILIRSFMADRLFPGMGTELIEEEFYFAACCCTALLGSREGWFQDLHQALKTGRPDPNIPAFLRAEFRDRLGFRFGLVDLYSELERRMADGFDDFRSPCEPQWRKLLGGLQTEPCRILELGCGSANDFRVFDAHGLAAHLDYTGVDASGVNVVNARRRFPGIGFVVGDACAIEAADQSFDVTIAFDLFEHLSPIALSMALSECLRVTRDECWISFFNAADTPAHGFQRKDDYHWNLLSLPRLDEDIEARGFTVEIISTSQLFEARFREYRHYNREAHVLIATRRTTASARTRVDAG